MVEIPANIVIVALGAREIISRLRPKEEFVCESVIASEDEIEEFNPITLEGDRKDFRMYQLADYPNKEERGHIFARTGTFYICQPVNIFCREYPLINSYKTFTKIIDQTIGKQKEHEIFIRPTRKERR